MNITSPVRRNNVSRLGMCLVFLGLAAVAGAKSFPLAQPSLSGTIHSPTLPNGVQDYSKLSFGHFGKSVSTPDNSGVISAFGDVWGGQDPSVSATITESVLSDPGYQPLASWKSSLSYSFFISGPVSSIVPVHLVGSLSDFWSSNLDSGGGSTSLGLTLSYANNVVVRDYELQDNSDPSGGHILNVDQVIDLSSQTLYTVYLQSSAQLNLSDNPIPDGTYSLSASVDPMITIDTSFDRPGFSIQFSPNMPARPAPETAGTLELIALSFIALVGVRRWSSRRADQNTS